MKTIENLESRNYTKSKICDDDITIMHRKGNNCVFFYIFGYDDELLARASIGITTRYNRIKFESNEWITANEMIAIGNFINSHSKRFTQR